MGDGSSTSRTTLMGDSFKRGTFDDFVRWLAGRQEHSVVADPAVSVSDAARDAWREFQTIESRHCWQLLRRVRSGSYYEEVELLAAADLDPRRRLPRLRTPNGFVVSALYAGDAAATDAPVGVLVECPVNLIEACRGLKVRILCGGQWVELGEIDVDGTAIGDLPQGVHFKPPLGLRVGELEECEQGGPGAAL